ncbi:prenyltransferase/squalene oxidase repeat-containing protein [Actinophytocola algeriensis]|uniref:Prenyltransferase alpha-alpha toroid domain-containing protein n=1 Tax=Actinophytocola algeriensis TaxID=1768010 RepID=A0A7W7QFN6_9PSEU|nr:hypothetical protein [Actinophytocola algeriensis]MBB4912712.1 hypothetical protein [Actinophytocola algeriensis]MBE1473620.1 hypothetical protein [Actinophytocola algeriensis]
MRQHNVAAFLDRCRDESGRFVETDEDRPSLEASRFGAEILQLIGSRPSEAELRFVADRHCGAGYAMDDDAEEPALSATYYALRLLELAGHPPSDAHEIARWLVDTLFGEGRVVVDMDDLFYGIRALNLAGERLSSSGEDAVRTFLQTCQHVNGGYGLLPDAAPDIERTYCAVAISLWMGGDSDHEAARAQKPFVRSCYDGGGHIRMRPSSPDWSLASGYWGNRCVELLELDWPWDDVHAATAACRQPDGGFTSTTGSSLWETYCALRVLDIATQHRQVHA